MGRSYTTCKSYLDDWLINDIDNAQKNLKEERLKQWKQTLKTIAKNTILPTSILNTLKVMIHRVNIASKDALLFLIRTETPQLADKIKQQTSVHLQGRYIENCLQIYYQISKKTKENIIPAEEIRILNSSFFSFCFASSKLFKFLKIYKYKKIFLLLNK